jgi:hypothetical protein
MTIKPISYNTSSEEPKNFSASQLIRQIVERSKQSTLVNNNSSHLLSSLSVSNNEYKLIFNLNNGDNIQLQFTVSPENKARNGEIKINGKGLSPMNPTISSDSPFVKALQQGFNTHSFKIEAKNSFEKSEIDHLLSKVLKLSESLAGTTSKPEATPQAKLSGVEDTLSGLHLASKQPASDLKQISKEPEKPSTSMVNLHQAPFYEPEPKVSFNEKRLAAMSRLNKANITAETQTLQDSKFASFGVATPADKNSLEIFISDKLGIKKDSDAQLFVYLGVDKPDLTTFDKTLSDPDKLTLNVWINDSNVKENLNNYQITFAKNSDKIIIKDIEQNKIINSRELLENKLRWNSTASRSNFDKTQNQVKKSLANALKQQKAGESEVSLDLPKDEVKTFFELFSKLDNKDASLNIDENSKSFSFTTPDGKISLTGALPASKNLEDISFNKFNFKGNISELLDKLDLEPLDHAEVYAFQTNQPNSYLENLRQASNNIESYLAELEELPLSNPKSDHAFTIEVTPLEIKVNNPNQGMVYRKGSMPDTSHDNRGNIFFKLNDGSFIDNIQMKSIDKADKDKVSYRLSIRQTDGELKEYQLNLDAKGAQIIPKSGEPVEVPYGKDHLGVPWPRGL